MIDQSLYFDRSIAQALRCFYVITKSPYILNETAPKTPDTNLPATLLNVLFGF